MSVVADRAMTLLDYLRIDEESDAILEGLARGVLDPAERLSLVAHGDDTHGAWAVLTDPQVAPLWALPHAAQWTGGKMPGRIAGESDEDYLARARAAVVRPVGMLRGSAGSLITAAQPYLTGTRRVRVVQGLGGSVWDVGVLVLEDEVIDLDKLTAAVNDDDVITAGLRAFVDYSDPLAPWTLAELEDTYYQQTLADVEGDFATLLDLENNNPIP